MAQLWAVFLAVGSLAIGLLGVLGVWLCYLFQAVALGPPPAPPPETLDTSNDGDGDDKNGLSEAELRRLCGVVQAEAAVDDEEEALCLICLDAMQPGSAVRVLPSCNRAFHQDCVDRWLTISPRCPVCNIWATPQSPQASLTVAKTAPGCCHGGRASAFLVLDDSWSASLLLIKKRS